MRDSGLVLIIGQVKSFECPMIGEPDGTLDVIRGTTSQRAEWMAREQVIATVRLAAGRSMPLWIPQDNIYGSLAAMILSEYIQADVAENFEGSTEPNSQRKYLLNLFRTTSTGKTVKRTPAWQKVYIDLGVMRSAEATLSLAELFERERPKLMVCIGSGPKVSAAKHLARQYKVHVEALDFSKEGARELGDNSMESRLLRARSDIQPMHVRSARDPFENERVSEPRVPENVFLYPPVPLLVYWQLEHYMPERKVL